MKDSQIKKKMSKNVDSDSVLNYPVTHLLVYQAVPFRPIITISLIPAKINRRFANFPLTDYRLDTNRYETAGMHATTSN